MASFGFHVHTCVLAPPYNMHIYEHMHTHTDKEDKRTPPQKKTIEMNRNSQEYLLCEVLANQLTGR